MESDTIKGHRLNNIYNPIFELTPEQVTMIDEVCKPFINQNNKSNIDNIIVDEEFEINRKPTLAYYGFHNYRDYYTNCCVNCSDYIEKICNATNEDIEQCINI